MVTLDGAPVDDLGSNAGNQTSEITLPAGWWLSSGFNVQPGGCDTSVTEFSNLGNGIYDIRIVPYLGNPACAWLSGQYIYAVGIQVTRHNEIWQGSTLGKLTIP